MNVSKMPRAPPGMSDRLISVKRVKAIYSLDHVDYFAHGIL